ncbi:LysR substrate-binding domain-containing protein [Chelativorans sp. SCAU2101]|jgi:Transcriptional regulator|uniref:LysR substrate-binding domain-containing protein n=1 Tax=Chelativorans petroleitrophicus TaxID=2975484 RepID=A0A9X3AZ19_9HYPH|nr:LysR substrate-binding domain-containing protein [Chelativorans petroleitrophicus]MCT8989074.1 LysR substrate-binding domain-containing protein [Chelativorans petroleitrophicus]
MTGLCYNGCDDHVSFASGMMFDFKQLKLFATVAEFGSLSRAAVSLSMTQPALSRQIKALETELGVELFYRNGRGVVLTEAGKLLDGYAKGILEQAARAASEIEALRSDPRGTIVIGMPPSVGVVLTAPLVQVFRQSFPRISMRVVEGFSGHILEWLVTGKIDVAVLYNAPRMSNLLSEPLLRDELFLLGAVKDPNRLPSGTVQGCQLTKLPMILPSRPHGLRLVVDHAMAAAGITPRIEMEVEAMPSTLKLVENGVGYTILSYSSVHHLVAAGRIRYWRIEKPSLHRELLLATSTQRPTTTAIRALTECVRKEVNNLRKQGVWAPPA